MSVCESIYSEGEIVPHHLSERINLFLLIFVIVVSAARTVIMLEDRGIVTFCCQSLTAAVVLTKKSRDH